MKESEDREFVMDYLDRHLAGGVKAVVKGYGEMKRGLIASGTDPEEAEALAVVYVATTIAQVLIYPLQERLRE